MRLNTSKLKAQYEKPINDFLMGANFIYYRPNQLGRIEKTSRQLLAVGYGSKRIYFNNTDIWHPFIKEILKNEGINWFSFEIDKTLKDNHYSIIKDVIDYMLSKYFDLSVLIPNYEDIIKLANEPLKLGWYNNGGFRWEDIFDFNE